jgi:hypothetical protein
VLSKVGIVFVLVGVVNSSAAGANLVSDLSLGHTRYRVGFKQMVLSDNARPFGEKPRRVRLSIWYPAVSKSRPCLNLKNYVDLHQSHTEPDGVSTFREWARRMKTEESRLDVILGSSTTACRDATPMKGRFPLIVYAASFRAPAYENHAMFEHLAGQGFVVVAIPSVGIDASGMTMDKIGVENQFRDLELAYRQALRLPLIDPRRVGTMGFSLGAVPAALLALRDQSVRACASIDGGMQYTYALLGDNLSKPDARLEAAYLQVTQRSTPSVQLDNKFYDSHAVSYAYHFQWKKMDHYDLGSLTLLLRSARPKDYQPPQHEIELNGVNETPYDARFRMYGQMTVIVYLFFDAHLRGSKASKIVLRQLIQSKLPEYEEMFSLRVTK